MEQALVAQQKLNEKLGMAVQIGKLEIVQRVVALGADPIVPSYENGTTPLMKAAHAGHLPVVKYLVGLNAHINEIDNALGTTPFHQAIIKGHPQVVEYLAFNGADLNMADKQGNIPLAIAHKHARYDIAQFLTALPKKLSYANITDSAKINNRAHVITLLINNPECINDKDYTGRTALAWAVRNDNYELVKYLLEAGADQSIADRDGITPLDTAFETNNEKLANLLLG